MHSGRMSPSSFPYSLIAQWINMVRKREEEERERNSCHVFVFPPLAKCAAMAKVGFVLWYYSALCVCVVSRRKVLVLHARMDGQTSLLEKRQRLLIDLPQFPFLNLCKCSTYMLLYIGSTATTGSSVCRGRWTSDICSSGSKSKVGGQKPSLL